MLFVFRRVEVSRAQPTFTHMALTALWARGALKFVVSQNCDGLHLRAGLPRRALAELHGDMFAELCAPCRRVYLRAFDTTERTARHAHGTRRLCHACGQELRDSIVHFGERGRAAWPLNWAGALRHAARADVVLCLGSSLKVLRRYPRLWRMQSAPRARPALYIVNLQWTPKDSVAALKINARCDAVMQQVARRLRLRVPRYRGALDPVLAHAEPLAEPEAHTTRRPPLSAPEPSAGAEHWEPSSPSASDSDEELPLRHLAARLRGPPGPKTRAPGSGPNAPAPAPHAPGPAPRAPGPPPDTPGTAPGGPHTPGSTDYLHSFQVKGLRYSLLPGVDFAVGQPYLFMKRLICFQVSMLSGEATILLRAEHTRPPPAPCTFSARARSPLRCRTTDLRRFRMARRSPDAPGAVNGHGPPDFTADTRTDALVNGTAGLGSRLRRLLEYEPRIDTPESVKTIPAELQPKLEGDAKGPKLEPKAEPKEEASTSESSGAEGGALAAGSLAAAIIRRAVLLCRASLYPGLHTIIAPPLAAPPECAWCERHFSSRRCLWYGPAREPALAARAWRRVRGRRYLCACCGGQDSPPRQPDGAPDDGGWYGKGYRKGRRRRR